jgi:hypothetical protein
LASFLENARNRLNSWVKGEEPGLKSVEDQTEEEKALVTFVDAELENRRMSAARQAQEAITLTNTAYLCGFDSVYFDGATRQFKPVPAPSQLIAKNRVHVNRILPTVQNRLAKLLKNEPRWEIRPNSGDEEDKDAARLGEQILIQLWDQLQINKKRASLIMWVQQAGSSYLKVCWDPTLGEKKVVPEDQPQEDGTVKRIYKLEAMGDIRVDVASFFEVFPDPLAMYWSECKSIVQAKIRPLSYFRDQYPERGHLVKEEDCWINSLQYEARINAINVQTGASGMSTNQIKDSAIERVYYERPCNKHPMGRYIVSANGVLLKDGVLPIDELPWIKFDDIIVGGKFNAEAVITHLRPLQDQLNRGKTMRAAFLNRLLAGKYIVARGANLARESLDDQSGEVVEYDPVPNAPAGGAVQPLDMPTIPSYAYEEEEVLKSDINDTAGINEASRGQMPSAQIPAIGMQLLVEQDDTRIGVMTESHEHSYADLGRILLKFVAKYYETPRLLKIAGEDLQYTVKEFRGADLRENFDVKVKRGSISPGSRTLKRQEILNLHQGGYFGNPTDPGVVQNVLSMLEYGDEYQAWKSLSLRKRQIKRGLEMIERGEKPAVLEFDDHALWLKELDDFRLSDKYLTLNPAQQELVLELMNEHADMLTEMTAGPNDPDNDIELKTTDAAQAEHDKVLAEAPPEAPAADQLGAQIQAQSAEMAAPPESGGLT